MEQALPSKETDGVSDSQATIMKPIQLDINGRSMGLYEIEHAIELAMGGKSSDSDTGDNDGQGNSLSLTSVGMNTRVTESLIRMIQQTKEWDSISLTNSMGDRTLCNDLLLACTTHPSVRSIAWRARIADAINAGTTRILETSSDLSTVNALLYGLKYSSHLTKLEATGLVLDVNVANLLSRALVRNTTLLELILNGTRFLTENNSNPNRRVNENHRGTKNTAVQTLSFGLRFNRTIESLSLDMCSDLEDEDIACLINAVNSDGTVLRRLSVRGTACFDQAMSSVAQLLQENVIKELDLSYLVRKRRETPKEPEKTQQENQQEEEEEEEQKEEQPTEEEKEHLETTETNSNEEENDGKEEKPAAINPDDEDDQKQGESSLKKDSKNEATKENDEEHQKVRNTSLRILSMAGNFLDDDYLESLLSIFPTQTNYPTVADSEEPSCSRLEELTLLGNRFSNHGVKDLLKKLPRFPHLQRLYLGFQRAPPPYGPTTLPQEVLSRMMTSDPSLVDRNTQFTPGSLRQEFVSAVSENPSNYRLTDVNIMPLTSEDKTVDKILRYNTMLNVGGRKLLASYVKSNAKAEETQTANASSVPLGLWPLVLDRANRLYPLPELCDEDAKNCDNGFHAGDLIFCLLHGPMIFENLDRRLV